MWTGVICLAALTCGVNVGWRPRSEGGMEYLIQIEPYSLDSLRAGTPIESDVPPNVKDIRSFSITVGVKTLPRESAPPTAIATPPAAPMSPLATPTSPPAASTSPPPPSSSAAPALNAPAPPADVRSGPKLPPMPENFPLPLPTGKKPPDTKPADKSGDKSASSSFWSQPPAADASVAPQLPSSMARAPTEQQAVYYQQPTPSPAASSSAREGAPARAETPAGSYFFPFVLTLIALAGSVSWNGFLFWALREARRRYRELQDYHDHRTSRATVNDDLPESAFEDVEEEEEEKQEEEESPRRHGEHGGKSRDQKRR